MQLQDRDGGGVKDPGTLYSNFLDLCMAKGSKKRLIDILLKNSEGGLTERILEEIKETMFSKERHRGKKFDTQILPSRQSLNCVFITFPTLRFHHVLIRNVMKT